MQSRRWACPEWATFQRLSLILIHHLLPFLLILFQWPQSAPPICPMLTPFVHCSSFCCGMQRGNRLAKQPNAIRIPRTNCCCLVVSSCHLVAPLANSQVAQLPRRRPDATVAATGLLLLPICVARYIWTGYGWDGFSIVPQLLLILLLVTGFSPGLRLLALLPPVASKVRPYRRAPASTGTGTRNTDADFKPQPTATTVLLFCARAASRRRFEPNGTTLKWSFTPRLQQFDNRECFIIPATYRRMYVGVQWGN